MEKFKKQGLVSPIFIELKIVQPYISTEKTMILRSKAKAIIDNWSVKNVPQKTTGGGRQIHTNNKEKFKPYEK